MSNEPKLKKENDISLEAMIIDEMIKENCSLKDAVKLVSEKNNNISKKEVYNASLNLKKMMN